MVFTNTIRWSYFRNVWGMKKKFLHFLSIEYLDTLHL